MSNMITIEILQSAIARGEYRETLNALKNSSVAARMAEDRHQDLMPNVGDHVYGWVHQRAALMDCHNAEDGACALRILNGMDTVYWVNGRVPPLTAMARAIMGLPPR